jgi:hypothetical protein
MHAEKLHEVLHFSMTRADARQLRKKTNIQIIRGTKSQATRHIVTLVWRYLSGGSLGGSSAASATRPLIRHVSNTRNTRSRLHVRKRARSCAYVMRAYLKQQINGAIFAVPAASQSAHHRFLHKARE